MQVLLRPHPVLHNRIQEVYVIGAWPGLWGFTVPQLEAHVGGRVDGLLGLEKGWKKENRRGLAQRRGCSKLSMSKFQYQGRNQEVDVTGAWVPNPNLKRTCTDEKAGCLGWKKAEGMSSEG